jgi:hypothetical protein
LNAVGGLLWVVCAGIMLFMLRSRYILSLRFSHVKNKIGT